VHIFQHLAIVGWILEVSEGGEHQQCSIERLGPAEISHVCLNEATMLSISAAVAVQREAPNIRGAKTFQKSSSSCQVAISPTLQ
jgi:hypothetical protein